MNKEENAMTIKNDSIFFKHIYPHFEKLCTLKRPPCKEDEVIEFVVDYAKKLKLAFQRDEHGNVAVYREGSRGLENAPSLLFQGHMDMVCVPDESIFPIQPVIENGWVRTKNSTLGADNGIAVAYMLELMNYPFTKNPPLEFLFTVQEEIGLLGAALIDTDSIKLASRRLINIDSEEIESVTVGCSGGTDFEIFKSVRMVENTAQSAYSVTVTTLGGHSGLKIHENIPNAIKVAAEYVQILPEIANVRLCTLKGGFAKNAIPAHAAILFCCNTLSDNDINNTSQVINKAYQGFESFTIKITPCDPSNTVLAKSDSEDVLQLISDLPHGVIKINTDTESVFSSVNLGLITTHEESIDLFLNIRSSDSKERMEVISTIESICENFLKCRLVLGKSYPGWIPDVNSELLSIVCTAYETIRNEKPAYLDIHAGLECGILMDKISSIQESVSIGPTIHNAHSIHEMLEIASTIDIWDILLTIIEIYSSE